MYRRRLLKTMDSYDRGDKHQILRMQSREHYGKVQVRSAQSMRNKCQTYVAGRTFMTSVPDQLQ